MKVTYSNGDAIFTSSITHLDSQRGPHTDRSSDAQIKLNIFIYHPPLHGSNKRKIKNYILYSIIITVKKLLMAIILLVNGHKN